MKKTLLTVGFVLSCFSAGMQAQIALVNPVPQQVKAEGGMLFDAPKTIKIFSDKGRSNSTAAKTLTENCNVQAKGAYSVTIGVVGDKATKKYDKLVPKHAEGYYLSISKKGAVIVGRDENGLYYGVQTLLASMSEGKLEVCTVTDWPDVPFRGVVEGFYGTPWSHEARLSQFDFYGRHKMNVYIYGPKDDPYHRGHWRVPYPEKEGLRIKELAEHAKRNGVSFYWAIHPGVDIKWNNEDRDALVAKLEQMYKLGVRAFAVFFDDIWGEGTKADKQAELLNYVDDNFIQKKPDVTPLVMCPTEYNRSWVNEKKGYLRTLGSKLNKSINIMWTGNTVVHCIDKEGTDWVNERIERKAYIWWNFPVTDFVRDHITLAPTYGNDLDIADKLSGFVSNPMEHAEASKIALYGVADYTWNMKAYDFKKDWEKAIKELLPGNAQALRTFALYNKDLGKNGHGFRREEGEELKELAADVNSGKPSAETIRQLSEKLEQLGVSCDLLLCDKSNAELVRELRPWLLQGKNVAEYGQAVCRLYMAKDSKTANAFPGFNGYYQQARSLQEQMYQLENSDVRHPLQPGIKVATKVMLPTLNKLFSLAVDSYNAKNATTLSNVAEYNPFKVSSTVSQLALLPVTMRGNQVNVTPALEVINWQAGGEFVIEGDRDITFQGMAFNLGVNDMAKNFKLELFVDGAWKNVSLLHYKADDPVIHTGNELSGMKASKLRLTNISGQEQKVFFKRFEFTKQ